MNLIKNPDSEQIHSAIGMLNIWLIFFKKMNIIPGMFQTHDNNVFYQSIFSFEYYSTGYTKNRIFIHHINEKKYFQTAAIK